MPPFARAFLSGRWQLAATGLAPKVSTFFDTTSRPSHFSSIADGPRTVCAPPPVSASLCSCAVSRCCRSRLCAQARTCILLGWLWSSCTAIRSSGCRWRVPPQRSRGGGALWVMLMPTPCLFNSDTYASLQYWHPLSEWCFPFIGREGAQRPGGDKPAAG